MLKTLRVASLALPLLVAMSASAQTWTLSSDACDPTTMWNGNANVTFTGNTAGCSVSGITATVTGWATKNTDDSGYLEAAQLTDQGGSGIGLSSTGEQAGSPNHAIDSSSKDELIMINFGAAKVSLTGFSTGWSQYDTDISILRWNGAAGGPDLTTTTLTGGTDGLVAKGWQLVTAQDIDGDADGSDADADEFGSRSGTISGAASSSWWIVSAYFGAASGNLSSENDYFKLLSFTGVQDTPPGVPEPGSLALVAAALLGVGYSRKRLQAKR